MNTLLIIILCLALLVVIWVVFVSVKMSASLSNPTYKTYENTLMRAKEIEHCYGDFDSYEDEPFEVTMRDGYVIHGDIYPLDPKKVVLISHGHGDNKYTGIRFLQVFRKLGYTTVIYDLRGHGHNEPSVCTMGIEESKDLMEVLEYLKQRFPDAQFGLHGLSMGCATTVLALKYKPEVDFVVADCGYGILKELCLDKLKSVKNPKWIFYPIDWINDLRFGYKPSEVNPIDALNENEIPICFIHSTGDQLIRYQQSEWMYERNRGSHKEIHLVPDAPHAQAWLHDPEAYQEIVESFLKTV